MATPVRRPAEETGRLGDEIYDRYIRHLVEADHHGELVAIDVDSGDYAIAGSVLAAAERLHARRPDADAWLVRVGHPTSSAHLRWQFPVESQVIEGVVNGFLEAVVSLPVRGPEDRDREIEAVIDTGYSGNLALPPETGG